jgi:hypothetical protein
MGKCRGRPLAPSARLPEKEIKIINYTFCIINRGRLVTFPISNYGRLHPLAPRRRAQIQFPLAALMLVCFNRGNLRAALFSLLHKFIDERVT